MYMRDIEPYERRVYCKFCKGKYATKRITCNGISLINICDVDAIKIMEELLTWGSFRRAAMKIIEEKGL